MIDENKLIEDINNLKGLKRIKSCMYSESGNTLLNNLALNIVKEVIKLINKQPKDHDLEWYKHEYYAECERNERLEKALDKACDELYRNTLFIKDLEATIGLEKDSFNKKDWKEWCMMLNREEILKCADRLQELEKLDIVKEFRYVLHEVINYPQEKPKEEYYKSSKSRDYYIRLPYEKFTILDTGKYGFKKHGYDAIGKSKDSKSTLYFCSSLCNYSKEKIMKIIDQRIKEDDENDQQ